MCISLTDTEKVSGCFVERQGSFPISSLFSRFASDVNHAMVVGLRFPHQIYITIQK